MAQPGKKTSGFGGGGATALTLNVCGRPQTRRVPPAGHVRTAFYHVVKWFYHMVICRNHIVPVFYLMVAAGNNIVSGRNHMAAGGNHMVPPRPKVVFGRSHMVPAARLMVCAPNHIVPVTDSGVAGWFNRVAGGSGLVRLNHVAFTGKTIWQGLFRPARITDKLQESAKMEPDKTVMRYDSSPPIYYDDPSSVYDENPVAPTTTILPMKYAILKLGDKSLDQKLTLTTDLTAALTTNIAIYAVPDPTVVALTAQVTAVRAKKTELDAAQAVLDTKQNELDALELALDNLLTLELAYIQKTSGGDEAKITLLGLPVKGSPTPAATPDQVQNLKLSPGKNGGEVLSCLKPLASAKGYDYDCTTDPTKEENWKHLDTSSGCRTTFAGLVSGQKIWVRARAVGKKNTGKGAWSDSASITVP